MYEQVLNQPVYQCTLGGWKRQTMRKLNSYSLLKGKHVFTVISIFQIVWTLREDTYSFKKCQNKNKKAETETVSHVGKMWKCVIKISAYVDKGRTSTQPPIDLIINCPVSVPAESNSNISPHPSEVVLFVSAKARLKLCQW